MEWIKCSDQMPTRQTPVLISSHKRSEPETRIICTAEWWTIYGEVCWVCVGADGYECENDFDSDGITHWMPLPEPPEE